MDQTYTPNYHKEVGGSSKYTLMYADAGLSSFEGNAGTFISYFELLKHTDLPKNGTEIHKLVRRNISRRNRDYKMVNIPSAIIN